MEEIEVYQHVIGKYYRKRKENSKFSYYVLQYCVNCGQPHLTDKYNPSRHCSIKCRGGGNGRPHNYRMSQNSKDLISERMTGLIKSDITKKRISKSIKKSITTGLVDYDRRTSLKRDTDHGMENILA